MMGRVRRKLSGSSIPMRDYIAQQKEVLDAINKERLQYQDRNLELEYELQLIRHHLDGISGISNIVDAIKKLVKENEQLKHELHYYKTSPPQTPSTHINDFYANGYVQGMMAFDQGKKLNDNPYSHNDPLPLQAWYEGWRNANLAEQVNHATAFLIDEIHNVSINKRGKNWIITGYDNLILTKTGSWIKQPLIREASEEFLQDTRFDNLQEAYDAARNAAKID